MQTAETDVNKGGMSEAIRQFLIGVGSILLIPAGFAPEPRFRITLPPLSSRQAIAHDFAKISRDMQTTLDKAKAAEQLELGI